MKRLILTAVFLLVLCWPIIFPFVQNGYFPTDDGGWAVVRLAEMQRELRQFQFPPRWSGYLNHGYGYPLFLFTYPLPYLLGELIHLIGFGLVDTIKILFIFSVIASALSMYLLAGKIWGSTGAAVAVTLYLYAPYRFVNLFWRGALGESLALVFFPLLFYFLYELIQRKTYVFYLAASLTLAALILTHNALAVLFIPLLILWTIFFIWQSKNRWQAFLITGTALINGILLAAFFWLPAIIEKKYIMLSKIPLADKSAHFLTVTDLFTSAWQFGGKLPLQAGVVQLIAAVVASGWLLVGRKNHKYRKLGFLLTFLGSATLIMLLSVSAPVWQLPLIREIDFPWRMLAPFSFILALTAGALTQTAFKKVMAVLCVAAAVFWNLGYVQTRPRTYLPDVYYETNDATTTSADELLPVWVAEKPTARPAEKIELVANNGSELPHPLVKNISDLSETATEIKFKVDTNQPALVRINTLYFPGWTANIDNRKTQIVTVKPSGLMQISLPTGAHAIRFRFEDTPVRKIANTLSLVGVLSTFGLWKLLKKIYH